MSVPRDSLDSGRGGGASLSAHNDKVFDAINAHIAPFHGATGGERTVNGATFNPQVGSQLVKPDKRQMETRRSPESPVIVTSPFPGHGIARCHPVANQPKPMSHASPHFGHVIKVDNVRDVYAQDDMYDEVMGKLHHCLQLREGDVDDGFLDWMKDNFKWVFFFDSIEKANEAIAHLAQENSCWSVGAASHKEYLLSSVHREFTPTRSSILESDGIAWYKVAFEGPIEDATLEAAKAQVEVHAQKFGKVHAIDLLRSNRKDWEFRVVFDSRHAWEQAVSSKSAKVPSLRGGVWDLQPIDYNRYENRFIAEGLKKIRSGKTYISPTARTAVTFNGNGEPTYVPGPIMRSEDLQPDAFEASMQRHQSAPEGSGENVFLPGGPWVVSRSKSSPHIFVSPARSSQSQAIFPDKIIKGVDCRTTIMLRNLPPGMTWLMLKEILDSILAGKYDFSYLRLDFSTIKHVGYGFVNFVDPMCIITFINAFVGRPWPFQQGSRFPKVAQISYATHQGLENQIERFRNSAILCESDPCRARLWYTYESAKDENDLSLIGKQRPFPAPNNQPKMERSIANARSSGLWNKQQHSLNQKHRRGQYDRGTPAAQREEMALNSPIHGRYTYDALPASVRPGQTPRSHRASPFGNGNGYMFGPSMNQGQNGYVPASAQFPSQYGASYGLGAVKSPVDLPSRFPQVSDHYFGGPFNQHTLADVYGNNTNHHAGQFVDNWNFSSAQSSSRFHGYGLNRMRDIAEGIPPRV